jgi:[acyl-carrier-protein] S-malonyltransferase
LLKPAGDALQKALQDINLQVPQVPLINNVDVAVESEPEKIRDALVRQAYSPVRWVEVVQKLKSLGATHMIEFGPGKVLTGLGGRIDKSIRAACVHDAGSLDKTARRLLGPQPAKPVPSKLGQRLPRPGWPDAALYWM